MAKKPAGGGKYRSAKSGEYVKEGFAKKNPDTTVKERDRPKPKKPKR